jgi:hypothetical protein
MATELTGAGFDVEETTLTQPVDIDQLIESITDEQWGRIQQHLNRCRNQRIAQAAAAASLKAAQERAANPTPFEQLQAFNKKHEAIDCAHHAELGVVFYQNGAHRGESIDPSMAMPGAMEQFQYAGARGKLEQIQAIYCYHEAKESEAQRRRQAVVVDDTQCALSHGFFQRAPENATELARVDGILKKLQAVMPRLLNLIDVVRQIEREVAEGSERDRLIAEAVAMEPETAKWMTK